MPRYNPALMPPHQRMDCLRRTLSNRPWNIIDPTPRLLEMFDLALTHDSYTNEALTKGKNSISNERLEFLGDAALELAVRQYVFVQTDYAEGDMTGFKQRFVSNERLAEIFDESLSELLPLIYVGEGQKKDINIRIKAGCFEAIIGAFYLEGGMELVNRICGHLFFSDKDVESIRMDIARRKAMSFVQENLDG